MNIFMLSLVLALLSISHCWSTWCALVPFLSSLPPSPFSPSLHFKRTNVSCSHCSTALVFCSQFSQEPGSSICFQQPHSNLTQSTRREREERLEEWKELRNMREQEGETDGPIWLTTSDIICCAIDSNNSSTRNQGFFFCLASSESKRQNNTATLGLSRLSTSKQLRGFDLNHGCMILFLLLQKSIKSNTPTKIRTKYFVWVDFFFSTVKAYLWVPQKHKTSNNWHITAGKVVIYFLKIQ